jgi:alkanesulfonate monooxygenase SsuD/methylene tetrahydromethanopterin reductase-like flavin-dependent oxidoreductase (luciferase family)
MHLMYFTQQPMSAYPHAEGQAFGATTLMLSNRFFDPVAGSRLFNEYLEHYRLAEEVGFDGLMLNEHHNTPVCMSSVCNVFAAMLAVVTRRVKIIPLGNPLPLAEHPIRLAEELAIVDMISRGRLVSGFVRGGGQEQLATGANPAFNRERFQEAHDLIVKAWTEPGPFRWEGLHYQYRVVNPWALPLQRPHPPIWIPGTASIETVTWAAARRYPYIALGTSPQATNAIWEAYDRVARESGYAGGPPYRGYLQRCHVATTEKRALENARQFLWMQNGSLGLDHPVWSTPSGHFSPSHRAAFVEYAAGRRPTEKSDTFEDHLDDGRIIAGTPSTVLPKLRRLLEETRPSIFGIWASDGLVTDTDARACIQLLGEDVLPALRVIGRELGLSGPFDNCGPA